MYKFNTPPEQTKTLSVCEKIGVSITNQDFVCLQKKTGPPEQTKTMSVCFGEMRR